MIDFDVRILQIFDMKVLLLVTPHVAAVYRAQDVADCFKSNLDKFDNNLDLECLVDWSKSYWEIILRNGGGLNKIVGILMSSLKERV